MTTCTCLYHRHVLKGYSIPLETSHPITHVSLETALRWNCTAAARSCKAKKSVKLFPGMDSALNGVIFIIIIIIINHQSWAVVEFHVSYQAVILFVYLLPRGWIVYVINVEAFLAIHN